MSWTRGLFGRICVVEGVYDWPGNPKFKGVTQLQRGDVDEVVEGNSKTEETT